MHRAFRFYAVGLAGAGLQLSVLAILTNGLKLHYLAATPLAVESAILHNFFWHCRWTFQERPGAWPGRLWRFHLGAGAVSLLGNLLVMRLLVEGLRIPFAAANLAAIGCCSLVNFLLADLWAFGDFAPRRKDAEVR